jgi:hypothetical protein
MDGELVRRGKPKLAKQPRTGNYAGLKPNLSQSTKPDAYHSLSLVAAVGLETGRQTANQSLTDVKGFSAG